MEGIGFKLDLSKIILNKSMYISILHFHITFVAKIHHYNQACTLIKLLHEIILAT